MRLALLRFFQGSEPHDENFTFDGYFASDGDFNPESVFLICDEPSTQLAEHLASQVLSLLQGQVHIAEHHVFALGEEQGVLVRRVVLKLDVFVDWVGTNQEEVGFDYRGYLLEPASCNVCVDVSPDPIIDQHDAEQN